MAPHLPLEFLTKLLGEPFMKDKTSMIFSKEFRATRFDFADQNNFETKGTRLIERVVFRGGFFQEMDQVKRTVLSQRSSPSRRRTGTAVAPAGTVEDFHPQYTLLHAAIDETDPPLACELIRNGIPLDTVNGGGQTPLLQALKRMWELHSIVRHIMNPNRPERQLILGGKKPLMENAQARLRYMVVVLIEQHANVNAIVQWQGIVMSSLHFACSLEDWELVSLLLEHGAHPYLCRSDAKDTIRPPPLCPCFSGQPVSECHSKTLPYPDHFTCSCGSTKDYGKCCKRRKMELFEEWDESGATIRLSRRIPLPKGPPSFAPPEIQAFVEKFERESGIDTDKIRDFVWKTMDDPWIPLSTPRISKLVFFRVLRAAQVVNNDVANDSR
ncbi:hypothetical protein B0H19DRAFT_1273528 [Mycena capillaripes]|nr:hypothetical protein B0H19DRAFT_1273528 [Mycena capillaripes]